MRPREEEEKKPKRPSNKANNPSSPASPKPLKHSDCIWPFHLLLDPLFAKTLVCSECKQIPKQNHAFTSESGHIFCEFCIDHLLATQACAKIDNKPIAQKNKSKVIDNLIKSLRIKCPHCKLSQLQQLNDCKLNEYKKDEFEDNDINMPPFPTGLIQQNSMMMNEGICQIAANNNNEQKQYVRF